MSFKQQNATDTKAGNTLECVCVCIRVHVGVCFWELKHTWCVMNVRQLCIDNIVNPGRVSLSDMIKSDCL